MSVVAKAIELLGYFSVENPEIGLSHLCRRAKRDKATTYRHINALQKFGFVEQNPITKAYRIGPAVLHLAEIREATVPRREGARAALQVLADTTGETAHVSILSGHTLHSLVSCDSAAHSTRAVIDLQILPLHATASGMCAVAFGAPGLIKTAQSNLTVYTSHTATTTEALNQAIAATRQSGFGLSDRGLEDDIYGLATPVFDQTGQLAGTVAVASVASRLTPERMHDIRQQLVRASQEISHNWGGAVPASVENLWEAALSKSSQRELAT